MNDKEKLHVLGRYLERYIYHCPFDDDADINIIKECVGPGYKGCGDCIVKHLEDLPYRRAIEEWGL